MPQDYNITLNLPKTEFEMRANLPAREPDMLKKSEANRTYYKMIEKNEGKPLYVLHDGPPYANGDIHLGTALNKVLKDIIVKHKNMTGFKATYIPGWDTHGLPIELKAMKKVGIDKNQAVSKVELRQHCRDFAVSYVNNQSEQFRRLGVLGNFDDPYLTLKPEFEATQIKIFGEMAKKGYVYKGLKPVYWCPECNTALAEAEIEYADDACYSIYVKFGLKDDKGAFTKMGVDLDKVYFVIWTTTTWTLPGNVAICVGPDFEYSVIKAGDEYYVMATELAEESLSGAGITEYETIGKVKGSELENMTTAHPFLDRESLIIVGDHVTLESGTGCVHTAPGHGVDDFAVCKNYDLPVLVPVDAEGKMTELAGEFEGLTTTDAGRAIAKKLTDLNALLATKRMVHQYPHCWRCKDPVLFRATEQWFCSIDGFKDKAIEAINEVKWIPEWGNGRITAMVRDRNDWCISRQRTWGVPIPIVYCEDCKKPIINDETIEAISSMFRKDGSDSWYIKETNEFLPSGMKCDCGCDKFIKETDIMDVWFDSGVTYEAVIAEREPDCKKIDLYLEGADQYRGWFQSSLLTSVAWKGVAPYKAVCTHGWVVDGKGKKMSKSIGNGILADEIVGDYGADILRVWVASSDYHADIRISKEILKQLSEGYRKIRNTARFILGNIDGFNPNTDMVADDKLQELDKWALLRLNALIEKTEKAYTDLDFHVVYHAIHNFCVVDMSNFYLDILKDRLYCEETNGELRRAAQTTMYKILNALVRIIAPILAFTSDEIWQVMPHIEGDDGESVYFNQMLSEVKVDTDEEFVKKWEKIHAIRDDVQKALENKRAEKAIKSSLEAKVIINCDGELLEFIDKYKEELIPLFIVSQLEVQKGGKGEWTGELEGLSVTVMSAEGGKCERCWGYSDSVGKTTEHPTICSRCVDVIADS